MRHPYRLYVFSALALAALCLCNFTAGSSDAASGQSKGATLKVWLGGILVSATPGTPFRKWIDAQTALFKKENRGVNVQITLLPADNGQLAAKVEAAFTAHQVPDVMMLYAGTYTTAYQAGLMRLNKYVAATPRYYNSLIPSAWDGACSNFNCSGGNGYIMGVPFDVGQFEIFYNKALFRKAGLTNPAQSYAALYRQCTALKKHGILPMVYGDRDGYATSNMFTSDLVSYFGPGDLQRLVDRKMHFTDPKIVSTLQAIIGLRTHGCTNDDASTLGLLNSDNQFAAGKAAMVEGQPQNLPQFVQSLGQDVGVAAMPVSGAGPWRQKQAGNAFDNWVIPSGADNPDLAWKWIKLATSTKMQLLEVPDMGSPPVNRAAAKRLKDPYVREFAKLASQTAMLEVDQAIPNQAALVLYRSLNQVFSGAQTPSQAMSRVDQAMASATH